MKKMTTLIPTQVIHEIQNYIKTDSSFVNINTKQHQRLVKVLVSLWYFIYSKQQNQTDKNLHKLTRIHSDDFAKFRYKINGEDFKHSKLLNILEFIKLIRINPHHLSGQYPYSYKILTNFLNKGHMTQFEIDFSKVFKNTRDKRFWLDMYPQHKALINDIYDSSVDLDGYLYWMQQNIGIELKPKLKNGMMVKRYLTEEAIFHSFNSALRLNLKNIWVKLSDENRLYSSVSNIPSTAIPFLKLFGKETYDIDISNSQPLLLSCLLSEKQGEYTKDVVDGVFYDKVADIMGIKRNEFKTLSYKYVFFNLKPLKSGKIYDTIEEVYPGLMTEINTIKETTKLAHKLQEMEAGIFVNGIGKLNFPKLLRHDQVIVTEENYDLVKQALRLEYNRIGIEVNLDE